MDLGPVRATREKKKATQPPHNLRTHKVSIKFARLAFMNVPLVSVKSEKFLMRKQKYRGDPKSVLLNTGNISKPN